MPARPATVPLTVCWSVSQLTVTLVTFAPPTVPVPPVTAQVWDGFVGCPMIVTAKAVPLSTAAGNVKRRWP